MHSAFHPKGVAIRRERIVQTLKYTLSFTQNAHHLHQYSSSDKEKTLLIGLIQPYWKGSSAICSLFEKVQDSV